MPLTLLSSPLEVTDASRDRTVTVVDYSGLALDTVTVTLDGTPLSARVEGTHWTAGTSNTDTAASLASALNAQTGIYAWNHGAVVYISPDSSSGVITVALSDTTNTTTSPQFASINVIDYTIAGTETIKFNVKRNVNYPTSATATATTLTAGTSFVAATSNTVTATNIAAAINSLVAGVDATSSGTLVTIVCEDPAVTSSATTTTDSACFTTSDTGPTQAWSLISVNPMLTMGPFWASQGGTGVTYTELTSGTITVSNDLYDSLVKQGGAIYVEQETVKLDGTDISRLVISAPSWIYRLDDKLSTLSFQVRGKDYNVLDHADAEAGKTVTIDHVVRGYTTGEHFTVRVWTGTVKTVTTSWSEDGQCISTFTCVDYNERLTKDLTTNLRLDEQAYNCVIAGVDDECEVESLNSASTIRVKAGAVLIDRTVYGGGTSLPLGRFRSWPFNSNSNGPGGGSVGTGGVSNQGIVRVDFDETTLDLSTIADITIDDPLQLGLKTIFVRNDGVLWATDDGCPPDGVPLASFELNFVGEIISGSKLIDQRMITLPAEKRFRGEVLKYVLEDAGIDASTLTLPTVYNDPLENPIQEMKTKISDWADAFLRPSLWHMSYDPSGNLVVKLLSITDQPHPATWAYHLNHMHGLAVSTPIRGEAVCDVTVRGIDIDNRGLTSRVETVEEETWEKTEDSDSAPNGSIGGTAIYRGVNTPKFQIVGRTKTTRVYLGSSPVMEKVDVYVKRNPLDHSRHGIYDPFGAGYFRNGWDSTPYPGNSTEKGTTHLYSYPKLDLASRSVTRYSYYGRVYVGYEKTIKEMRNKVTNAPTGSIGWDDNLRYGWTSDKEDLEIVSIVEHKIKSGPSGFVKEEFTTTWGPYNIHVNYEGNAIEGASRASGRGTVGETWAYHDDEEKLCRLSEQIKRYRRHSLDPEYIEIVEIGKTYKKEPGASANNTTGVASIGPINFGDTQATTEWGGTKSTSIVKGDLPAVQSLADDIDRIPVGHRVYSSTAAAVYGSEEVADVFERYAESREQCERLARWMLGTSLGWQFTYQVAMNPKLELGQTIQLTVDSPNAASYTVRGIVTGLTYTVGLAPTDPAGMGVTMLVDYNSIKTQLATRT